MNLMSGCCRGKRGWIGRGVEWMTGGRSIKGVMIKN
jgi:hypothetical protein